MGYRWRCICGLALLMSNVKAQIPTPEVFAKLPDMNMSALAEALETQDKVVLVLHIAKCEVFWRAVWPMVASVATAVPDLTFGHVDVTANPIMNAGEKVDVIA